MLYVSVIIIQVIQNAAKHYTFQDGWVQIEWNDSNWLSSVDASDKTWISEEQKQMEQRGGKWAAYDYLYRMHAAERL